jgi:hypothetical protein
VLAEGATIERTNRSPYEDILADSFDLLHPNVRNAHLVPLIAEGFVDVEHGIHWLTPLMVRLMRLPSAGPNQSVKLNVDARDANFEWNRTIGNSTFRTYQHASDNKLVERNGPGSVSFQLEILNGSLHYRQTGMSIYGLQIPQKIAPRVSGRVAAAPNGWLVEVKVTWRSHLVCRYAGELHLV